MSQGSGERNLKRFYPAFPQKAGRFQGQRPWSQPAGCEIPRENAGRRSRGISDSERRKGSKNSPVDCFCRGNPRRGFPRPDGSHCRRASRKGFGENPARVVPEKLPVSRSPERTNAAAFASEGGEPHRQEQAPAPIKQSPKEAVDTTFKRVTLFAGHYGSGKTNLAVNYAIELKKTHDRVVIADLDIVNPYFRTKDSSELLNSMGIETVSPEFANSNVDLPALPSELYGVVQNRLRYAVLDIGGDDRGAYALGRFAPYILEENDFEMIYVANFCRPLTQSPEEALEVMREIETAGGILFTAIVNNSNLAHLTTAETVLDGYEKCRELSSLCGLPVLFSSAERSLAGQLSLENVFPIDIQNKYYELY